MNLHKLLLSILIAFQCVFLIPFVSAGVSEIPGRSQAQGSTIARVKGDTPIQKIQNATLSGLRTVKVVLNGLAVAYLIYIGAMMIVAMGAEDQIAKQRMQLLYGLIAFLFINIPGYIYAMFGGPKGGDITSNPQNSNFTGQSAVYDNIFVSYDNWDGTLTGSVIWFMRVVIIGYATFMFLLSAIQLLSAGGDEEKKGKSKNRIINGVLGLIFLGIIEGFVRIAYTGDFGKGQGMVAQLANLALFFVGPIALFFIIYAGWMIIASGGDEEKVKKGKKIIIQVALGILLLLASYTFLGDLSTFKL